MKLPSFVSDIHSEDPERIDSRLLLSSLARIRRWLLLLATINFLAYVVVFCSVVWLATKRGAIGPDHVVSTLIGVLVASVGPILMVVYANRIQVFIQDGSPGNFLTMLVAQRYLWSVTGLIMLLGLLLLVVALVLRYLDSLS